MDGPIIGLLVADCGRNCHLGHNGGSATTHDILIQQQHASPCPGCRNSSIHAGSARSDYQDVSRYVLHVDLSRVLSQSEFDPNGWAWIFPSLDKEGWTRPREKYRAASLSGADGVVGSTTDNRWLEPTTPSARAKEAAVCQGKPGSSRKLKGVYR